MDPKTTAVVLIGTDDAAKETMESNHMLDNARAVVDAPRSAGATVIHAPLTFASTTLDFILRSKGIQTVALGGFLTNCCVDSTMRSAYERGYEVVTLTDCVAATSREEHEHAIRFDYPMFSKPMSSTEFTETLQGTESATDTSRGYGGKRGVSRSLLHAPW